MNNTNDKLLGTDEAAAALGIKPGTIRLWGAQRKIATVKLGRRRLIPEREISRLIAENTIPAKAS
jgi:excisionase family DNA binding protein